MGSLSNDALSVAETHTIALRFGNRLIAHSANPGWRNLYASLATETNWAETLHPVEHPCFVYCLRRSAQVRRKIAGSAKVASAVLAPRQFAIIPAHVESRLEVSGNPDILLVYLRRSMIDCAIEEYMDIDPQKVEFLPRLGETDPMLEQLARSTISALRSTPSSGVAYYVDSLAHMIAVQLLTRHSNNLSKRIVEGGGRRTNPDHPRLSRARDYIDAYIGDDLTIGTLARQTKVSPSYLMRLFREHLGLSPHRYILLRRIQRARNLLRATEMPIADIAVATGFSSQSHLTSTFQKYVGVSPGCYRRSRHAEQR